MKANRKSQKLSRLYEMAENLPSVFSPLKMVETWCELSQDLYATSMSCGWILAKNKSECVVIATLLMDMFIISWFALCLTEFWIIEHYEVNLAGRHIIL